MKYTGTIEQVRRVEETVISTGNYTVVKDRPSPDPQAKNIKPSASILLYDVYLDPEAKKYQGKEPDVFTDMDNKLKLFDYPSVACRFAYFGRDNKAEVKISPRHFPQLLAAYPQIAQSLAPLQYADSYVPAL